MDKKLVAGECGDPLEDASMAMLNDCAKSAYGIASQRAWVTVHEATQSPIHGNLEISITQHPWR